MSKAVSVLLITVGVFLLLIASLYIAFFRASPVPASLLIRRIFENSPAKPPVNYTEIASRILSYEDIEYPSSSDWNVLDIYTPKEREVNTPVILWVHGGAFVGGDKSDVRYYAQTLAASGYAVVTMNYLRAPEGEYPTPFYQLNDVYHFLVSKAEVYHLDMNRIVLAGDSAGAQIVSQASAAITNSEYAGTLSFQMEIPQETLQGVLLYCGPYSITQLSETSSSHYWKQLVKMIGWGYFGDKNWQSSPLEVQTSVINHIGNNFPPAFVTDGNKHSFEPQGRAVVRRLEERGITVDSLFFEPEEFTTVHEYQFIQDDIPSEMSVDATLTFLEKIL